MMNDIFRELIFEGKVVVYIDDILIFTKTLEEHREVVRRVLQILQDNKLYLKPEKCDFEKTKIEFLGLVVSQDKVEMDPVKLQGVSEWPRPQSKKDVQSFIGFTNFYRRFIKDYALIARPLHDLTGNSDWEWSDRQEEAFKNLKKAMTSAPVLHLPSDHGQFMVECDSSDYATGAVISQKQSDGKWHPIAYLSKSLNAVERNYDIYDKELLAIIRALEECRHLLEGAEEKVEIWTDHKNLEYFRTAKKLNRRQARWSLFLSRFNYNLHHRPGKKNRKPDGLTRRTDHEKVEKDNKDVVLLKIEGVDKKS